MTFYVSSARYFRFHVDIRVYVFISKTSHRISTWTVIDDNGGSKDPIIQNFALIYNNDLTSTVLSNLLIKVIVSDAKHWRLFAVVMTANL